MKLFLNKSSSLKYPFSTIATNPPISYPIANLPINQYLMHNLSSNHIYDLKPFQYQMYKESQGHSSSQSGQWKNGNNCFLNSCTGSGKTLAYLVPVLDRIMSDVIERGKQAKNKDQGSGTQLKSKQQHGAVILTLNKQLCLQIYRTIRQLDPKPILQTKRTGPISHFMPVVNLLSTPPKTAKQADIIDAKISNNLINSVKWSKTDIIISTPQLLYNILGLGKSRNQVNQDLIRPQFVVVDQADLLLEIDVNVSRYTYKVIQEINSNLQLSSPQKKSTSSSHYKPPTYLFTASSFPKTINKIPYFQHLSTKFPPLKQIPGEYQHKIPRSIQLSFIQLSKLKNNKQYYLKDVIQKRCGIDHEDSEKIDNKDKHRKSRVIIFCNKKSTITELQQILSQQLNLTSEIYHASLDSSQRSRALHSFQSGNANILISTDLGSRGLDFTLPIDLIIQYEMAQNITGFINRVGRTGRNGVKGQVITMVEEGNQQLFKHIQELVRDNQKLDQVFSRKRSYNKLYKDKQK